MKVVIPGGTGQVGTLLARKLKADGHEVVALGRSQRDWPGAIDGADIVINLAGRSVNCRYTQKNKDEILSSRVSSVRTVGQAIRDAKHPPAVWLQASTATIYSHRYDAPNDETTGLIGGTEPDAPESWRFSIDVVTAWERALDEEETPGTRKVKLRSAIILSPDSGGIFGTLLTLVRLGLGGTVGDGRQYVSWIHITSAQEGSPATARSPWSGKAADGFNPRFRIIPGTASPASMTPHPSD